MPFRVNARTVLHLGSELISSDAVAFYELIKNAFDARSDRVDINVVSRIRHEKYLEFKAALMLEKEKTSRGSQASAENLSDFQQNILNAADGAAPNSQRFKRNISEAGSLDDLLNLLIEANYIEINDRGEGMSFSDLNDVYLTIGTRSRLEEREEQRRRFARSRVKNEKTFRPILGEKGVGRLSAMRLGDRLRVRTSKKGEEKWNVLEIDWAKFSHDSDELISDIDVEPEYGEIKENKNQSGTSLFISALTSDWDQEKVSSIARSEFSKLTDPFDPSARYRVALRYNGDLVPIEDFDEKVFARAHAVVEAEFLINEEADSTKHPVLRGKINYRYRQKRKSFTSDEEELRSEAGVTTDRVLISLGSFRMKFYWFNRSLLTAAEGVPDFKQIQALVKQWAGGLMVFRDGFRVNPYGDPDDDWLDLDQKALASGGYKVNRRQIIGKVEISSILNPGLLDQTNREGLRDSEEKQALINLLKHTLKQFRGFLNQVDKKVESAEPLLDLSELDARVSKEERMAQQSLRRLISAHSTFRKDENVVAVQEAIGGIRSLIRQAKDLAQNYVKDREQFVHLAGLGLMVEFIGHELTRATNHALATLGDAEREGLPHRVDALLNTLKSQLSTLQKRLRVLDPLSTAGRQRKSNFDLIHWVKEIVKNHDDQFERHKINVAVAIEPRRKEATLRIDAVQGMIVQILENLISNSVYWLDRRREGRANFAPEITITINTVAKEIYFQDNGPGVNPEEREEIFQPFFTKKRGGDGKGLGLFIAREVAQYNGAALYLSDERTAHADRLNTFVIVLEAEER